jgi:hypothetical protein
MNLFITGLLIKKTLLHNVYKKRTPFFNLLLQAFQAMIECSGKGLLFNPCNKNHSALLQQALPLH